MPEQEKSGTLSKAPRTLFKMESLLIELELGLLMPFSLPITITQNSLTHF